MPYMLANRVGGMKATAATVNTLTMPFRATSTTPSVAPRGKPTLPVRKPSWSESDRTPLDRADRAAGLDDGCLTLFLGVGTISPERRIQAARRQGLLR